MIPESKAPKGAETNDAPPWPTIKTARDLVLDRIVPCSEELLKTLAKRHGIGRKLGRAIVFTPDDVSALIQALPRSARAPERGDSCAGESARPSAEAALAKALLLSAAPKPKTARSGRRGSR
ncbi:MAG TPA: hypothetical protein VHZ26_09110 [Caulobacteraceae bacterium]|jgi:hypothetical protein|nr:hypothetical protein [Caulobacteraceae bacterium]